MMTMYEEGLELTEQMTDEEKAIADNCPSRKTNEECLYCGWLPYCYVKEGWV